jgi:hypothetical protein
MLSGAHGQIEAPRGGVWRGGHPSPWGGAVPLPVGRGCAPPQKIFGLFRNKMKHFGIL